MKKPISATIDIELLKWIDKEILQTERLKGIRKKSDRRIHYWIDDEGLIKIISDFFTLKCNSRIEELKESKNKINNEYAIIYNRWNLIKRRHKKWPRLQNQKPPVL